MITVVTKPFEKDGRELPSGQVVDSTTWRNESRLINTRFLREATESEVTGFKKAPTAATRKAKSAPKKPTVKAKAATVKAKTPKRTPPAAAPATAETENPHSI